MQWADLEQNLEPTFPAEPKPRRHTDLIWNVMTIITLLGIAMVALGGITIFSNPNSALNPFPPPTLPVALALPSATPTPRVLPPTWTPTPTQTLTPTITPPAPIAPADAVLVTPGNEETEAVVETQNPSLYAFSLQGEVKLIDATIFRAEHGCDWMGVAGQAFDLQGRPATGITVQIGGSLGSNAVDLISLTGTALWYGQAGYEVFLSDTPVESQEMLWVRLMDQSGLPLSAKVYFDTSTNCEQNLAVVNFKQVR